MNPPRAADDPGVESSISTLVLVQDVEYDLQAKPGSIFFSSWGLHEALNKKRVVPIALSLISRERGRAETTQCVIPLVVTPPLTSRFRLITGGASLNLLLRVGSTITFSVEFVPPLDHDDDGFESSNFQDQITVQTRLARLCVRLTATRNNDSIEACSLDSFLPRFLPSVKAPSLKFFDQIERDATNKAMNVQSTAPRIATSVSGSFHPQKSAENRIASLDPLPRRQPTPPQSTRISRPPSREQRTPSPRILEPLTVIPTPNVTADIDNQAEAREVIRRLRARRASQQSEPTSVHSTPTIERPPTRPESQLDGKTPVELDEFNALIRAAKMGIACEMDKAKQELDFYKSLLPKAKTSGQELPDFPTPFSASILARAPQADLKKPARLATLSSNSSSATCNDTKNRNEPTVTSNQDLSPVKVAINKPKKKTMPVPDPEVPLTKETKPRVAKSAAQPVAQPRENLTSVKPRQNVPRTVSSSNPSASSLSQSATEGKKNKPVASVSKATKKAAKTVSRVPTSHRHDDALLDFDDADPDVDHAPLLPDDLRSRQEEEDEDPMLTMKVPF